MALYWGDMYINRLIKFRKNAEPVTKVNLEREKLRIQVVFIAVFSIWTLRFFYILTNVYEMMFYVILFGQWESMKPDYTAFSLIKINEKK